MPERLPAGLRLSARSYLRHMGRIQGLGTAAAARRGDELLERFALAGDPEAPVATLSKGNAQKVALAQALLAEPELLVLDEPWSGLDSEAHRALGECLAERREAGAVVLLTEHQQGTVAATADAVHHLRGGRLAGEETPAVVAVRLARPAEERLGSLAGVRAHDGDRLEVDPEHADAVLAELLRRGHSIHEVSRSGGRPA